MKSHISLCILGTAEMIISRRCMCIGSDSARKTLKQGGTVRARLNSKEVEDELASMRGTRDTDRIAYPERKAVRGVCNVEEEPRIDTHSAAGLSKDESAEISTVSRTSRDSSPVPPLHMTRRHTVKSASDKGISCVISRVPCTKVLSESTSGFGVSTPFDRS